MKNTRAPALIPPLMCEGLKVASSVSGYESAPFPAQAQGMCQVFCLKVRNVKSSTVFILVDVTLNHDTLLRL